jgi:DNA polymerase-3 subunit delta'
MSDNLFKIYANENVLNTLTSMISSGRLSQAFLLFGQAGLGKKTIARYMAAKMLCESEDNSPCGECKNCRMIAHNTHPDVTWITTSDNAKAFSVDNLRKLSVDAFIYPNEGSRKVYILADCDNMTPLAQNTLLKLIEEPPEHCYFIFTATSKAVFLPTIISRVISFGVAEVSNEECRQALIEKGITDENIINEAIEAFGTNIGMCLSYINDDELTNAVDIAKDITDNITNPSEYQLLKALSRLEGNKILAKYVISLMYSIIRDSSAIRLGNDCLVGCYKKGSEKLSRTVTLRQANEIYRVFTTADSNIDANANLSLTITNICSQIKSII